MIKNIYDPEKISDSVRFSIQKIQDKLSALNILQKKMLSDLGKSSNYLTSADKEQSFKLTDAILIANYLGCSINDLMEQPLPELLSEPEVLYNKIELENRIKELNSRLQDKETIIELLKGTKQTK